MCDPLERTLQPTEHLVQSFRKTSSSSPVCRIGRRLDSSCSLIEAAYDGACAMSTQYIVVVVEIETSFQMQLLRPILAGLPVIGSVCLRCARLQMTRPWQTYQAVQGRRFP